MLQDLIDLKVSNLRCLSVLKLVCMQVRQPFYNSLLAGAIPVTFDSQLLQILPFPDHMHWQNLTVQVNPENITTHKALIADMLKVKHGKLKS